MKRKYLLTMILLVITQLSWAQSLDIQPSDQAQGILSSKNAMVDHTTGLFHYKVPLYEIKSGNFTLPITLNYVVKGVKVQAKGGSYGHNWSLYTGGVITRVMRGGIPDEEDKGYIRNPLPDFDGRGTNIKEVNTKVRDGEVDLFTASFNGQTLHFMLKIDPVTKKIIAEPIEKTNVIFQCEGYNSEMMKWVIIDEEGTKYTFEILELVNNAIKENFVGLNGVNENYYISSWYLTKIEPMNTSPIVYTYSDKVDESESYNNYSLYNYGRPMEEYLGKFDKELFDSYIERAQARMNDLSMILQVARPSAVFKNDAWENDPMYEIAKEYLSTNNNILGTLYSFSNITGASREIINILNQIISIYKNDNSHTAYEIKEALTWAKNEVKKCYTNRTDTYEKEVLSGTYISVRTPKIASIKFQDKTLKFSYNGNRQLSKISLSDNIYNNEIRSISFEMMYNHLTKILFAGSDGKVYNDIKLEYYLRADLKTIPDFWGYHKSAFFPSDVDSTNRNIRYTCNVDIKNAINSSLSKITTSEGGVIELKYQSNTINNHMGNYYMYDLLHQFGGIRIGEIVIKDKESAIEDRIEYKYPNDGESVYYNFYNTTRLEYPEFSDNITTNYFLTRGVALINTGNNGIYYPYVEEKIIGKGTTCYKFVVPPSTDQQCDFWAFGVLSATAQYDINNRLERVTNYEYNLSPSSTNVICNYDKYVPQMKIDPFYIDYDLTKKQFSESILLYSDNGDKCYFNSYERVFLPNIAPRTNCVSDWYNYDLYYGGKVLVTKKTNYFFENSPAKQPDVEDFYNTSPKFSQTDYFYDNAKFSLKPIREVTTDSEGTQTINVVKRVSEMDNSADPILATMKTKNLLNSVIKTQTLVKKATDTNPKLVTETVYKYGLSNDKYIAVDKIYDYFPKTATTISSLPTSLDNRMFTFDESEYTVSDDIDYGVFNNNYIPVRYETKDKVASFNYNSDGTKKLATCYDFNNAYASLVDYSDYIPIDSVNYDYASLQDSDQDLTIDSVNNYYIYNLWKMSDNFSKNYKLLNLSACSDTFKRYAETTEHKNIIKIINNFSSNAVRLSYHEIVSLFQAVMEPYHLEVFENQYIAEFPILKTDEYSYYGIRFLTSTIFDTGCLLEPEMYDYLAVLDKINLLDSKPKIRVGSELKVTNIDPSKRYAIYTLAKIETFSHTCYNVSVNHSAGTLRKEDTLDRGMQYKLYINDLDLSSYNGISYIKITDISSEIKYIALVPAGAEFEAISYNADGTIFCKFNHNGQAEFYEYDTAMRPIKIYDQTGSLIKQVKYNHNINK